MSINSVLKPVCAWLETLSLHDKMQNDQWMVPTVQTVHILAIGIVFSSSLILSLRAVGVSGIEWSPAQWGRRLNRWVGWSLLVLLVSGSILIVGEPARSLLSPVFQLKMVLVAAAGLLAWTLAHRLQRRDQPPYATGPERALGVLIVLLWVAVISCGRWIAYYAG
jgi:hypothetical protein